MELVVVQPETPANVSEGSTVSEDDGQADNSMLNDNWARMNKSTEKLLGPKKRWSLHRHALPMVLGVAVLVLTVIILYWITRVRVVFKESDSVVTASQVVLGEDPGNFLDPNCTDLACRCWKALDASSLVQEVSASKEWKEMHGVNEFLAQTLQALNVSNGKKWKEMHDDNELLAQTLQALNVSNAKKWKEMHDDNEVLAQTLQALNVSNGKEFKEIQRELSEEHAGFRNFTLVFTDALALLRKELDGLSRQSEQLKALVLKPRDCSEVKAAGNIQDGVYTIQPGSNSFKVYCVMTLHGGGWTVFQRRMDGTVDFHRTWNLYRDGFGDIIGDHWLGLRNLHALTGSAGYQFRVDVKTSNGHECWAGYDDFSVGLNSLNPENDGYPLRVTGWDSRSTGKVFSDDSGVRFSTYDRNIDDYFTNYHGAWWHYNGLSFSPNGFYYDLVDCADGYRSTIYWAYCNYGCITFVEMKVRPAPKKNK
ncbi:fibrinogen C domain-containing protein 1-B-like isoform X2 [Syngnathus scovelli]|uniref:fibrinogen C domain-containing protein 1-B-like isoform X2 n=1 Tax=Syngnathus scovelli TaxID=161590 RepID=UPI002110CA13|nr:fibrinogen C domain-containing protein 1-B-like isoform X2 [Syngnathus scovelli]